MKGYKGTDKNMRCRGMQYEIGKSYHADGYISVCDNGLHFCERLSDVFEYYKRNGNRFFEVEASGEVKTEGRKSASSDLRIIRELSDIEINRTVYGYGNGYGNGDGYGYGYGYGDGYGDGCGNGNGYGNGDGYGYGYGYGYGNGNGNGDGYGNGNGDGYGYGYGYGYGNIQKVLMLI